MASLEQRVADLEEAIEILKLDHPFFRADMDQEEVQTKKNDIRIKMDNKRKIFLDKKKNDRKIKNAK